MAIHVESVKSLLGAGKDLGSYFRYIAHFGFTDAVPSQRIPVLSVLGFDVNKYLYTFVIAALLVVSIVAAFNYIINPYGMFNSSPVKLKKTQAYTRGRILKAHAPLGRPIDILLVGNSRVELGLPTDHEAFKNKQVYNLGLPGADVTMQSHYAFNAIANNQVSTLIMGLDFVDFIFTEDSPFRQNPDSYIHRLQNTLGATKNDKYNWIKLKDNTAALLSLDALKSSLTTLLTQSQSLSHMKEDGKMHEGEFFGIVEHEGIGILFQQKENTLRNKFHNTGWIFTNEGTEDSFHFENFLRFISAVQSKNIKVYLFISPLHQRYLEILAETGYLSMYSKWKTLLGKKLAEQDFFDHGEFWDFSVSSGYTQEAIPPAEKKGVFMQWYWEPAHYRSTLGAKILDSLLLKKQPWGVPLNPERTRE